LGWNLPSVASLVGDEKPTAKKEPKPTKEVVSKEKASEKVSGNVTEKASDKKPPDKKAEAVQASTTKTANRTILVPRTLGPRTRQKIRSMEYSKIWDVTASNHRKVSFMDRVPKKGIG
jgi:hypothetical protein